MQTKICPICGSMMQFFDAAEIMYKYEISYFRCESCGFVQTEDPYWLDEAYSSAITDSDVGLLDRNLKFRIQTSAIFKMIFPDAQTFLDYGGGYGIYVRLMRDKGFDFEWYDAYCENLFAKEHEKSRERYDIITCFELVEHVYDPTELFEMLLKMSDTILFTTDLNSYAEPRKVNDWWYYCTDHGQHIAIHTRESLLALAAKLGKTYDCCGGLHIFSDKKVNLIKKRLCKTPAILACIDGVLRRESLLGSDYKNLTGHIIEG